MLTSERHKKILDILKKHRAITTAEIVEKFDSHSISLGFGLRENSPELAPVRRVKKEKAEKGTSYLFSPLMLFVMLAIILQEHFVTELQPGCRYIFQTILAGTQPFHHGLL